MKPIHILFLLMVLGCGTKESSNKKTTNTETIINNSENKEEEIATPKEDSAKKEENTFLNIQKTPCSGDCPVYNVTINKEGYVIFNGLKYTLLTGKHEFQLNEKEFTTLKNKLNTNEFLGYNDKYENPKLTYLPSTIITHEDKKIEIRLWKEVPDKLIELHEFIEELLIDKKCIE